MWRCDKRMWQRQMLAEGPSPTVMMKLIRAN